MSQSLSLDTTGCVKALFFFLVMVFPAMAGMTLEEALKALGHEEASVRDEASLVLEKGGWETMSLLENLETDDPEVLFRVNSIREVILLGLHDEGSAELRAAILLSLERPPAAGMVTLREFEDELKVLPGVLAGLHSQIVTSDRKPEVLEPLKRYVEIHLRSWLREAGRDFAVFEPTHLSAETCATLFNFLDAKSLKESSPIYLKWLEVHPALPDFLNKDGIMIELSRLRENGDILRALSRLDALNDSTFFDRRGKNLASWIKLEPFFDEPPSPEISRVLLMIHFDLKRPGDCLPFYRILLKRYPEFSQELGERLSCLEVVRLREDGDFYQAYDFLQRVPDAASFRDREVAKLAEWARAHRDQLERGLPEIAEGGEGVALGFLSSLVKIQSNMSFLESEKEAREMSELLGRSQEGKAWRGIIEERGGAFLKVYLLLEEERLWIVLQGREKGQNYDLEPEVGRFLMARPELEKQLPVQEMNVQVLAVILGGVLWDLEIEQLKFAARIASEWELVHPGLLDREGSAPFDKLLTYRKWFAGDRGGALGILSKSKIPDYEKSWLLQVCLGEGVVADLDQLLTQTPLTTSLIFHVFRKLIDGDDVSDGAIRNAFALVQWNCRSGDDPGKAAPFPSMVTKHAFRAWLAGEDERAFEYMEMIFWAYGRKTEWRHRLFPLWCHALGRTEEVLRKLRANANSVCVPEFKMAHLLYAAGRFEEALRYGEAIKDTPLLRDLLIAVEDWKSLGEPDVLTDDYRREVRVAWSYLFQNDPSQPKPAFDKKGNEYRDLVAMMKGSYPEITARPPVSTLTALQNLQKPMIGNLCDPRKVEFRTLDAFVEVQKRWLAGEEKEARSLLEECFSRMILDEDLGGTGVRVEYFENAGRGNHSARFTLGTPELCLYAALELKLPSDLAGDVVRSLARFPTSSDGSLIASRYFQSVGDDEQALLEVHFSFFQVEVNSLRFATSRVALYHYLQAMIAANREDFEQVFQSVTAFLKHAPHQNDHLVLILKALPEEQRKEVLDLVTSFWEAAVEAQPDVAGFQVAQGVWSKRAGEFR
ncbi:hypothetical protein V2O64_07460 [Verrucomicrobiaceae bacterium 227]